ncbi:hypothetical protein CEXT_199191 [Caerostris extrusa]|uniref:Uncharacterized protein n=1 Tax=Caerostris extrusa TaxID=172846 RepID=A0AAV4WUH7_CAEEX|nr:hypothetical protein CEXT_199191 [Caerostris extrusa]
MQCEHCPLPLPLHNRPESEGKVSPERDYFARAFVLLINASPITWPQNGVALADVATRVWRIIMVIKPRSCTRFFTPLDSTLVEDWPKTMLVPVYSSVQARPHRDYASTPPWVKRSKVLNNRILKDIRKDYPTNCKRKRKAMVEVCPLRESMSFQMCPATDGGRIAITQPFLEGSGRCGEAAARGTETRQTRKKAPRGINGKSIDRLV